MSFRQMVLMADMMADTKIEDSKEEEVTEEEATMVEEEEATMEDKEDEEVTIPTLVMVTFPTSVTIAKRYVGTNGVTAQSAKKTKGEPMEMATFQSTHCKEMALKE